MISLRRSLFSLFSLLEVARFLALPPNLSEQEREKETNMPRDHEQPKLVGHGWPLWEMREFIKHGSDEFARLFRGQFGPIRWT